MTRSSRRISSASDPARSRFASCRAARIATCSCRCPIRASDASPLLTGFRSLRNVDGPRASSRPAARRCSAAPRCRAGNPARRAPGAEPTGRSALAEATASPRAAPQLCLFLSSWRRAIRRWATAMFPGGPLEADELVTGPEPDWTFAKDVPTMELQLVDPPQSRGHPASLAFPGACVVVRTDMVEAHEYRDEGGGGQVEWALRCRLVAGSGGSGQEWQTSAVSLLQA